MFINRLVRVVCVMGVVSVFAAAVETEKTERTISKTPMSAVEMREWLIGYATWLNETAQGRSRTEWYQAVRSEGETRRARWSSASFRAVMEDILDDTEEARAIRVGLMSFLWNSPSGSELLPDEDRAGLRSEIWDRIQARDEDILFYRLFSIICLDSEIGDFLELLIHEGDDRHAERLLGALLQNRRLFVYDMVDEAIIRRAERFPDRAVFHHEWRVRMAERRTFWTLRTYLDKVMLREKMAPEELERWTGDMLSAYRNLREVNPEPGVWANAIDGIPSEMLPAFRPYLIRWLQEEHPSRDIVVKNEIVRRFVIMGDPKDTPLIRNYLYELPMAEFANVRAAFQFLSRHGGPSDYEYMIERQQKMKAYATRHGIRPNHLRWTERSIVQMRERLEDTADVDQ